MNLIEKLAFAYIILVGFALIMFAKTEFAWENTALLVFGIMNMLFVLYFAFGLDRINIKVSVTKE